jgi:hypothetical protein
VAARQSNRGAPSVGRDGFLAPRTAVHGRPVERREPEDAVAEAVESHQSIPDAPALRLPLNGLYAYFVTRPRRIVSVERAALARAHEPRGSDRCLEALDHVFPSSRDARPFGFLVGVEVAVAESIVGGAL